MKIRHLVLRAFWRALTPWLRYVGRQNKISITCDRWDGGGAQWHARISTMAFCSSFGFPYFHSEIEELLPVNSPELRKKWNQLVSLNHKKSSMASPNQARALSMHGLLKILIRSQFKVHSQTVSVQHCHFFTDYFPHEIEAAIKLGKLEYANPANLEPKELVGLPTLAVHIRRGHMGPSDETLRLTSDAQIIFVVTELNRLFGPLSTTIYSALPDAELESKLPVGVKLNSSADEFEVIHNLVNADYMLMAKSSMSYVAAVLSRGIVFYEPFWHPPLGSWKQIPRLVNLVEKQ
jgi:hypothetical protein